MAVHPVSDTQQWAMDKAGMEVAVVEIGLGCVQLLLVAAALGMRVGLIQFRRWGAPRAVLMSRQVQERQQPLWSLKETRPL